MGKISNFEANAYCVFITILCVIGAIFEIESQKKNPDNIKTMGMLMCSLIINIVVCAIILFRNTAVRCLIYAFSVVIFIVLIIELVLCSSDIPSAVSIEFIVLGLIGAFFGFWISFVILKDDSSKISPEAPVRVVVDPVGKQQKAGQPDQEEQKQEEEP